MTAAVAIAVLVACALAVAVVAVALIGYVRYGLRRTIDHTRLGQ